MSEHQSERITSMEGGESRLLRSGDVVGMLEEQGVLGADFWACNEVLQDGALQGQKVWYDVIALQQILFQDGAIASEALQQQLHELQAASKRYYQENIAAELQELNQFLVQRAGVFVVDPDTNTTTNTNTNTNTTLEYMLTREDKEGKLELLAHYSDDTEVQLVGESTYIDTTKLIAEEQLAIVEYVRIFEV